MNTQMGKYTEEEIFNIIADPKKRGEIISYVAAIESMMDRVIAFYFTDESHELDFYDLLLSDHSFEQKRSVIMKLPHFKNPAFSAPRKDLKKLEHLQHLRNVASHITAFQDQHAFSKETRNTNRKWMTRLGSQSWHYLLDEFPISLVKASSTMLFLLGMMIKLSADCREKGVDQSMKIFADDLEEFNKPFKKERAAALKREFEKRGLK